MTTYADTLDYSGRATRQRKPRILERDFREHDETTVTLLRGDGYTIEQKTLLVGDWAWELREQAWLHTCWGYNRFVIERKTLADLRDTKRLTNQLFRARRQMAQEQAGGATFFVLLVEHKFDTDIKRKWTDKAIRHAKLSAQFGGVRVTDCGENEIATALDGLFIWSQKSKHEIAEGGV